MSAVWTEKTVLLKTEAGRDAFAQRLPVLPVRLRPALILVDGKRAVGELAGLLSALGGEAALQELLSLGLVEKLPPATFDTKPAAAQPAQAGDSGSSALSFADYASAVKVFFDRELGPNGQILVLQMGGASDMRALRPLVDRGLDNLKYFKGVAAVEAFKSSLGKQAPRA